MFVEKSYECQSSVLTVQCLVVDIYLYFICYYCMFTNSLYTAILLQIDRTVNFLYCFKNCSG